VAAAARDCGATTLRDVSASTRRVVARDIALLDANVRTFLQICALVEEPIELPILEQMWPKGELFAMIEQVLGRYLLSDGSQFRFVHATVMESVLETIPIEIPLRHRVIEALRALPQPRLEDYERMAKQFAACGDSVGEREALIKLSQEAAGKSINTLSADALERALAIAPPERDEIIATYAHLSQMYNVTAREADAIRIARTGIGVANAAGILHGLGPLVASIVIGQWHSGLNNEARATLTYYEQKLTSDEDRANLFSVGEFISMHCLDLESAGRYRTQFERYASSAVPIATIRHHISNAFIAMRTGDGQAGLARIDVADRAVASAGGMDTIMPLAARILHAFHFRGMAAADELVSRAGQERKTTIATTIRCQIMISRGELDDVEEFVADHLRDSTDSHSRDRLLGAGYTASALRRLDPAHPSWESAWPLIARFETGERSSVILPVVCAALIPLSLQATTRARRLLDDVIRAAREPIDAMTFVYPVLLASAARSLGARDALESIAAQGTWSDSRPWNRAQEFLARGAAASALGSSDAHDFLDGARAHFMALGSTYFASLATEMIDQRTTFTRAGKARPNNTTRREGEIAALVAEGLTNREIAEKLVLSERTIEGHVANLFAKCNVNSRTQLATWFLRNFSSAS
jgi:DNA-binding CsgD family transcriptional regulator